jgi:uncharacterized protein
MEEIVDKMRSIAIEQLVLKDSIHGVDHWEQVHENGVLLALQPGVDLLVVRLFAYFHDCKREDDHEDEFHGYRAAEFVSELYINGTLEITQNQHYLLYAACKLHNTGVTSNDPTIGACFDADRLELTRCGINPRADLMSTPIGKRIAIKISQYT